MNYKRKKPPIKGWDRIDEQRHKELSKEYASMLALVLAPMQTISEIQKAVANVKTL